MTLTSPYDVLVPWCKLDAHAGQTDAERHAAWHAETVTQVRPDGIPSSEVLSWLAKDGRYQRLEAAGNDGTKSAAIRSVCKATLAMVLRPDTHLRVADAEHAAMVQSLVDAGIATSAEAAELAAMAVEQVPRPILSMGRFQTARRMIEEGA